MKALEGVKTAGPLSPYLRPQKRSKSPNEINELQGQKSTPTPLPEKFPSSTEILVRCIGPKPLSEVEMAALGLSRPIRGHHAVLDVKRWRAAVPEGRPVCYPHAA